MFCQAVSPAENVVDGADGEMKEEWVGRNYVSNKGSRLKSPAHICRKCLIAFRKVLQWVTSVSKSFFFFFLRSAANYVSGVKCHGTLLL